MSTDGTGLRTFGVEEELLVVDAATLHPVALGDLLAGAAERTSPTGHALSTELKQEQIEVVGPPRTTFQEQLAAIRAGRALADDAAAAFDARVVALSTSPWRAESDIVPSRRTALIEQAFGLTAVEQLTCGLHVHVGVESPELGISALDRLRVWLPVLLALSSNSPFWMGRDSGFASYRYQAWSRWPTSGPTGVFGSVEEYQRQRADLLRSGVPLDDGMLYYDARLSSRFPTVEVRVADVCLRAEHAATIATLIRALVETCLRDAQDGAAPPAAPTALLRAWSWRASRYGVTEQLVDPVTRELAPAAAVSERLFDTVAAALTEPGELAAVQTQLRDILDNGSGASRQRGRRSTVRDLDEADARAAVEFALQATHGSPAAAGDGGGAG